MRLTVLGASAVRPNPGGACSGYLVDAGAGPVLVDCGPGVVARLTQRYGLDQLRGILVSHAHPDHILDLVCMWYGAVYGPQGPLPDKLRLCVGPGTAEVLEAVSGAFGHGADFWQRVFDVETYEPSAGLTIAGMDVAFAPTQHYVDGWGMRFQADGVSLTYTSDTGPCGPVAELARSTDLLLAECTLASRAASEDDWGHMSAAEAGTLAAGAAAGRLLLTHIWSEHDPGALVAEAARTYPGPVAVAEEGREYAVA